MSDTLGSRYFTCPKCGSHLFSTVRSLAPKGKDFAIVEIGVCRDKGSNEPESSCDFTWNRDDDDDKVITQQTAEQWADQFLTEPETNVVSEFTYSSDETTRLICTVRASSFAEEDMKQGWSWPVTITVPITDRVLSVDFINDIHTQQKVMFPKETDLSKGRGLISPTFHWCDKLSAKVRRLNMRKFKKYIQKKESAK